MGGPKPIEINKIKDLCAILVGGSVCRPDMALRQNSDKVPRSPWSRCGAVKIVTARNETVEDLTVQKKPCRA